MIKKIPLLILSSSLCFHSFATEQADKWDGWLAAEGAYNDDSSFGDFNSFIPLVQDDSSLSYANILLKSDNDFTEGQAGLGYREIINEDWAVGGYGFFGNKQSENNNNYNQLTLGAEVITYDWDFRFNAYIPIGDNDKEISRNTATNQIRQEFVYHGVDLEVGYRLPIWDENDDSQMRIFGGGYYFDSDGAEHISGSRVRLEYELDNIVTSIPGSNITLGTEYQHDNVNKDTHVFTASFTLPFDFFRSNKQSQYNRLTPLERRLNKIKFRRVDIITNTERDQLTATPPPEEPVLPPPPIGDGDGVPE